MFGNKIAKSAPSNADPFLRETTGARKSLRRFRDQHAVIRYSFVFIVGFAVGAAVEVFACKTRLYDSVIGKKDARRHELDEFVVDYRRQVEKWQEEDMRSSRR